MPRSKSFADDSGSASLEFVTTGLILLVPLIYLVLVVAAIQAAALGAEGAARQAARVFVQAGSQYVAGVSATRAVQFALADHGVDPATAAMAVSCRPRADACLTRQGFVTVSIDVRVPLPLAPAALQAAFPLSVPIHATATQQVSRFWTPG